MRRSLRSETGVNELIKEELRSKDLEIRSLSQQVVTLTEKSSLSVRSDMTVTGDSASSRSMRHMRRSLKSEMNVNAQMREDLKTKESEIDQLYRQLNDLKDLRAVESCADETIGDHWSNDADVSRLIEQVYLYFLCGSSGIFCVQIPEVPLKI